MEIQYKIIDKVERDYYGDGLKVNCVFKSNEYQLFIFSTGNYINSKESLLSINGELANVLSWIETNEIEIHKKAVDENYDWLFDQLISDSDYYAEKGSITLDELVGYTHLGWIKILCGKDKIKSFLLCYKETEGTNESILGGHTFGKEVNELNG
ncbi:MAG: hypothetical protein AB6733_08880 [Clostridiaceae bacterium]